MEPSAASEAATHAASVRDELRPAGGVGPDELLEAAWVPAGTQRERFLGFMVHELRNPLASALWSAEMLAKGVPGDERRARLAQLGARSVQRLRGLLEDVFAIERMPAAAPAGEVVLQEAIARSIGPHDLEPNGIGAQLQGPDAPIVVAIDPLWLDRLLTAVARRVAHAGASGPLVVAWEPPAERDVAVTIRKAGLALDELDPPPLAPSGGGSTTFALLLARLLALRVGARLTTGGDDSGAFVRLVLPLVGN